MDELAELRFTGASVLPISKTSVGTNNVQISSSPYNSFLFIFGSKISVGMNY